MAKVDFTELPRLIALVEKGVGELPIFSWDSHDAYRAAEAQLSRQLFVDGARLKTDGPGGAIFELGGIRAVSTQGPTMAMKNWVLAARKACGADQ